MHPYLIYLISDISDISMTREIQFCWYFSPHLCAWLNWREVTVRAVQSFRTPVLFTVQAHYLPVTIVCISYETWKNVFCSDNVLYDLHYITWWKYNVNYVSVWLGGFMQFRDLLEHISANTSCFRWLMYGACIFLFLFSCLPLPLPTSIQIFLKPQWF